MCNGLIGRKLGMSTVYSPEGKQIPVTVVELGPCTVAQVKTESTDGYNSLQLSFGERKEKRINSPFKGHLKKSGLTSTASPAGGFRGQPGRVQCRSGHHG